MTNARDRNKDRQSIIDTILPQLPAVTAIYLFGSRATDNYSAESDFDIAVIVDLSVNPETATQIKMDLSARLRHDVDFVDLCRADTVTKFHIISQSEVLWDKSPVATAEYETIVYSQYSSLNTERAGILQDIEERGSIYGR